jgi:N-acetylglucosamine kinase-like BadF-type ATPase
VLLLGVDAGGTKTHAVVCSEDGWVLGAGSSGPGNWESVGLEGTYEALWQAISEALGEAEATAASVAAATYGLGGLDWPWDEARLRSVVERLGVGGPQILVNDAFVALRAGAGWGIVVVAGTGTTCAGRNRQGETARTLGLGPMFDDWGSAPEVAGCCIRAVARAYTGRGPATGLTDHLTRLFGARDAADLLEALSRGRLDRQMHTTAIIQALAEEAMEGDEVAVEVSWHSGRELGKRATALVTKLGMVQEAFPVMLAGGLFRTHNPVLLETLETTIRAIAPHAHLKPLKAPPVVGSALMAMDTAGLEVEPAVQEQLAEEVRRRFPATDSLH